MRHKGMSGATEPSSLMDSLLASIPLFRQYKIQQWIQQLPLAKVDETCRILGTELDALNQQACPPKTRLRTLEQFLDPINYCKTAINRHLLRQSAPLQSAANKQLNELFLLYNSYVNGYRLIIDALSSTPRKRDIHILSNALTRAMGLLSEILLTSYRFNSPQPRKLWAELHRLYQLAEASDLLDAQLDKANPELEELLTIDQIYKRSILLSLADPYHLRPGEIDQINNLTQLWAEQIQIRPIDNPTASPISVGYDLTIDQPPRREFKIDKRSTRHIRLVNLAPAMTALKPYLVKSGQPFLGNLQEINVNIPVRLVQTLLLNWSGRKKRRYSRKPKDLSVRVSLGLETTFQCVHGPGKPRKPNKTESHSNGNTAPLAHTTGELTLLPKQGSGMVANDTWNSCSDTYELPRLNLSQYQKQGKPMEHDWYVVNSSACGYCLRSDLALPNVKVGQIIGIRGNHLNQSKTWQIGVIRWMQCFRDQGVRIGIQIVAPKAIALNCQPYRSSADTRAVEGLILPEIKAIKQPSSLLTPPGAYRVGDVLILEIQGRKRYAQLLKLLEDTRLFSRYQYKSLTHKGNKGESKNQGSPKKGPHLAVVN